MIAGFILELTEIFNDTGRAFGFAGGANIAAVKDEPRKHMDIQRLAWVSVFSLILDRLQIDQQEWLKLPQGFDKFYKTFAGGSNKMKQASQLLGYQRLRTT